MVDSIKKKPHHENRPLACSRYQIQPLKCKGADCDATHHFGNGWRTPPRNSGGVGFKPVLCISQTTVYRWMTPVERSWDALSESFWRRWFYYILQSSERTPKKKKGRNLLLQSHPRTTKEFIGFYARTAFFGIVARVALKQLDHWFLSWTFFFTDSKVNDRNFSGRRKKTLTIRWRTS